MEKKRQTQFFSERPMAVLDICDRNVVFAEDGIVVKEESKRKCQ